jgi:CDGSH-type Zn-finger protein
MLKCLQTLTSSRAHVQPAHRQPEKYSSCDQGDNYEHGKKDMGMPIAITLDPGIYYRCGCGKSKNLPFCDESHSGSADLPIRFEIDKRQKVFICGCSLTGDQPFCDGSCGVSLEERR